MKVASSLLMVVLLTSIATGAQDETPPDPIAELVTTAGPEAITLTWTNVADDGSEPASGSVATISIWYSNSGPIDDNNYGSIGTEMRGAPAPLGPGLSQSWRIEGLAIGIPYWFAIWSGDEVALAGGDGGWSSACSTADSATPLDDKPPADEVDTTPPGGVTLTVAGVTSTSATLKWSAPGDDGYWWTAASYDVRYSIAGPITDATWATSTTVQAAGEPVPEVAFSPQTFKIKNLLPGTTYFFALKSADEAGNASPLSNSPTKSTTPLPGDSPDSWTADLPPVPTVVQNYGVIVPSDDPDVLYAAPGKVSGQDPFYKYTISTATWTAMGDLPFPLSNRGSTDGVNQIPGVLMAHQPRTGYLYLIANWVYYSSSEGPFNNLAGFYRFDTRADPALGWTALPSFPVSTCSDIHLAATAEAVFLFGHSTLHGPRRVDDTTPYVDIGLWKYSNGTWAPMKGPPDISGGVAMAYPGSGDFLYLLRSTLPGISDLWLYSISGDSWISSDDPHWGIESCPFPLGAYGRLAPGPGNSMYLLSSDARYTPDTAFLSRYDTLANQWSRLAFTPANTLPGSPGAGMSLAWNGGSSAFCLRGEGTDFWEYSEESDRFVSTLDPTPGVVGPGGSLVRAGNGNDLYALQGSTTDGFFLYSSSSDAWSRLPATPEWVGEGGCLVHDGADTLYAAQGGGLPGFWAYSISGKAWSSDPSRVAPMNGVGAIGRGGDLAFGYDGHIYALHGANGPYFSRFDIARNTWEPAAQAPGLVAEAAMVGFPGRDGLYAVIRGLNMLDGVVCVYSKSRGQWNVDDNNGGPQAFASQMVGSSGTFDLCVPPSGNKLFLVSFDDQRSSNVFEYDIDGDRWMERAKPSGHFGSGVSAACTNDGTFMYVLKGGSSRTVLRYQTPDASPELPSLLVQYYEDGGTRLPPGEMTVDSKIVIKAFVSDPDDEPVRIEVRVAPIHEPYPSAPGEPGPAVRSGEIASVEVTGLLPDVMYRWQVRAVDPRGIASTWRSFQTDPDAMGEIDFKTRSNEAPTAAGPEQRSESGAFLPAGGSTADAIVTFRAVVDDADLDPVSLEVEVISAGGMFRGIPTASSAPVSSGRTAEVQVTEPMGSYEWRYRAVDKYRKQGGWLAFSGGGSDFKILSPGSANQGGCGHVVRPGCPTALLALLAMAALICRR